MKKLIFVTLLILVSINEWGQNLEKGIVIEYNLPAKDNNTVTFYLGEFSVGMRYPSLFLVFTPSNTEWRILFGQTGQNVILKSIFVMK